MKERRSLMEGLKTDPATQRLEEEFVYGARRKPDSAPATQSITNEPEQLAAPIDITGVQPDNRILPQMIGRIPVTTRCRPQVASALKRASLQRQLAGVEPFYVQDILEEALETWLREKGYV